MVGSGAGSWSAARARGRFPTSPNSFVRGGSARAQPGPARRAFPEPLSHERYIRVCCILCQECSSLRRTSVAGGAHERTGPIRGWRYENSLSAGYSLDSTRRRVPSSAHSTLQALFAISCTAGQACRGSRQVAAPNCEGHESARRLGLSVARRFGLGARSSRPGRLPLGGLAPHTSPGSANPHASYRTARFILQQALSANRSRPNFPNKPVSRPRPACRLSARPHIPRPHIPSPFRSPTRHPVDIRCRTCTLSSSTARSCTSRSSAA